VNKMNNELFRISSSMRKDWDDRARKDAYYYIASWKKDWDEQWFLCSGEDGDAGKTGQPGPETMQGKMKSNEDMAISEDLAIEQLNEPSRAPWETLWPVLIDIWIAGVLAAFFLIRVVESSLGKRVVAYIMHELFR
jgi:hypothetical protein